MVWVLPTRALGPPGGGAHPLLPFTSLPRAKYLYIIIIATPKKVIFKFSIYRLIILADYYNVVPVIHDHNRVISCSNLQSTTIHFSLSKIESTQ